MRQAKNCDKILWTGANGATPCGKIGQGAKMGANPPPNAS